MSASRRQNDTRSRKGSRVKKRSRPQGNGRHILLIVLFSLGFAVVAGRLIWIQTVKAAEYSERAFNQRLRDIELQPRRGTIYDREGEPLAVSIEAKTIYAAPNRIKDKEGVAKALADTLGGNIDEYAEKLAKKSGFEYIARKVDIERAEALKDLDLEGVGFLDDYKRVYPSGELACQVLGFVGVDDEGLAGVEQYYEEMLGGVPGVLLSERDPQGQPIPGGVQKEIAPTSGRDIVLTIDKDIQYETQLKLAETVKKHKAKGGSIIVMNPRNGEIYAMASTPGFNPNDYSTAKVDAVRNKALSDAYEPGSTLKTLTAAAVVEEGLFKPSSMFHLPSTIKVGDRTIHESHGRRAVDWSLAEILTNSSNVGTVKLGLALGEDRLYQSLASFGLTEKTGVDFPGEARGWLPSPDKWSASSIGNIPFGQGISVTPLQLSRAVSGVANHGEMPTPHFLLDIPNADDTEPKYWPLKRVVTKETSSQVTSMLTEVVTEGTGSEAAVPGYVVAGKTGTAQKALPNGGGYAAGKFVGSFIGYLPAEDPRVLVCVTIDEPQAGYYGGTVAAPAFSSIAQFAVEHLKVPPSSAAVREESGQGKKAGVGKVSDKDAPH